MCSAVGTVVTREVNNLFLMKSSRKSVMQNSKKIYPKPKIFQ